MAVTLSAVQICRTLLPEPRSCGLARNAVRELCTLTAESHSGQLTVSVTDDNAARAIFGNADGGTKENGRHPTAHEHCEAVRDVTQLRESRILLVERLERLERVVVALALTRDAEAAAEERPARLQERGGVRRITTPARGEWAVLAQRYRDLLRAIDLVNDELHSGNRRAGQ